MDSVYIVYEHTERAYPVHVNCNVVPYIDEPYQQMNRNFIERDSERKRTTTAARMRTRKKETANSERHKSIDIVCNIFNITCNGARNVAFKTIIQITVQNVCDSFFGTSNEQNIRSRVEQLNFYNRNKHLN